jgi:hypothetical protein
LTTASRCFWPVALVFGVGCFGGGGNGGGGLGADAAAADASPGGIQPSDGDAAVGDGSVGVAPGSDAAIAPMEAKPHRIIYWGDFDTVGLSKLVVRDSETGNEREVELDSDAFGLVVSADAMKIAVASTTSAGMTRVWLYDADDLSSRLTIEEDGAAEFWVPSIAMDSRHAVYNRKAFDPAVSAYVDELHFVDLSALSTPVKKLTLPAGDLSDAQFVWSPGGALALVLGFNTATAGAFVATVDDAGTASTDDDVWSLQAVDAPCDQYKRVSWDAQERLYCAGEPVVGAGRHLYRFDPKAGVSAVELDMGDALDVPDLAVSPDGKQLAYVGELGANGNEDLFVLDLATEKLTRLTQLNGDNGADVHDFIWRPDSRALLAAIQWDGAAQPGVSGSLLEITLLGTTRQVDAPMTTYQVSTADFTYTADSAALYFTADVRTEGDAELFRLNSFTTQAPDFDQQLVRGVVAGGDVNGVAVGPLP